MLYNYKLKTDYYMNEIDFKKMLGSYLSNDKIKMFEQSLENDDFYNKGCIVNLNKVSLNQIIEVSCSHVEPNYKIPNCFLNFTNENKLSKTIYHHGGAIYLVDPSSVEVIYELSQKLQKDSIVLDMCASPGGKTILLALLRKDITIVANEVNIKRNFILQSNINRMGLTNVIVTNNSSNDFLYLSNFFDAVVLDVPCSGIGMLRKKEKMEEDYTEQKVENLIPIQQNLVEDGSKLVKTNGFLIYSTCSFNIKEDEEIIKNFLDKTKLNYNLYNINIENTFQSNTKVGYHLIPPFYKGEGHYVCYLKNDENKIDANRTLLKKVKTKIDDHEFECYKYKDNYYLQNKFYIELSKLNITMLGIQINPSFKDSKTKLNHFITHVDNLKTYDEIYLTEQEAFSYLKGAQIKLNNNIKTNTKIVVVKYNNTSLGFAKKNDTILQNYYPKQLRIKE